ncbi:protein kinase [Agrobacterium vitis]|nr:protein kinase [Agrobacterium vitis]
MAYVQSFGLKAKAVVLLRLFYLPDRQRLFSGDRLVFKRGRQWTMADYNLWADLFDTWQSSSDWIKALIIVTPPVFAVSVLALLLRHRRERPGNPPQGAIYQPPQRPEDSAEIIDVTILDAATNLQTRLEEARRTLLPQIRTLPDSDTLGRQTIRQQIEQIILEEYHRRSDPADALERVREFLRQYQTLQKDGLPTKD